MRARRIIDETIERCPQYADKLRSIRFEVSGRMTACAGKAFYARNLVKLSLPYFADEGNADSHLFETVTHEAAHLVMGPGYGHGGLWKRCHREMGGKGERCHSLELASGYTRRKSQARVESQCSRCDQPITLGPRQAKKHEALRAAGREGYRHRQCPR